MKFKTILAVSLFVMASSSTGIALASCGSCGESSCSSDSEASACSCADPGAYNSSSCTGAARYCELFGNIGRGPADIQSGHEDSDDEIVTEGISYNDYRGTDDQFNRRTYNVDAPRPQYK